MESGNSRHRPPWVRRLGYLVALVLSVSACSTSHDAAERRPADVPVVTERPSDMPTSLAAGACTAVTVGGCGFVFGALVAGSANLLLTSAYNRTSLTSLTGTGAL